MRQREGKEGNRYGRRQREGRSKREGAKHSFCVCVCERERRRRRKTREARKLENLIGRQSHQERRIVLEYDERTVPYPFDIFIVSSSYNLFWRMTLGKPYVC